jgi:hypothetical protein
MFAALAIGAPIGMALYHSYGLEVAMISCMAVPICGNSYRHQRAVVHEYIRTSTAVLSRCR